ncbi:hypothetical protein FEM33_01690 [Dyadobacter flavalbus]|uniref:Uncharacterized protein n=1 Tax=Dyadobacter flavalbus TaxID=2579942 RepID=A0A5M8R3U4_9BACT|nr:hypothetical protein [Dyadobacter flavalbus]KAA6441473.1 hypothetical protein FEM33_01690 [Dyadobacter flavalbus]
MRITLCTFVFIFVSFLSFGQKFYVEPTEKGYEVPVIEKMRYENYILTETKAESDYTVQCLLDGHYNAWKLGSMFKGYIRINDSKTDKEVARTKEVGKSPSLYNGFQAGPKIMQVISDKHLLPILRKLSADRAQKVGFQQ